MISGRFSLMCSQVTIKRASSVTELPINTWGDLASGRSLFQSADWLRAVEADPAGSARYCVAWVDGAVAGVLPVYLPTGRMDSLYQPELHFSHLAQAIPATAPRMGVLLAARSGYRTDFLLAEQPKGREVLSALVHDAMHTEPFAFVLFATIAAHQCVADSGLAAVTQLAFAADANLPVTGATLTDYLASLPSRRRTRVRHEMQVFRDAGLRIETIREATELGNAMDHFADMYLQLQRKHNLSVNHFDIKSELVRQIIHMGTRAVHFICRAGDMIIGFSTAYIGDDRWLYLRMGGFDYGKLRSAYEYFNTVIYRPLLFCAENGYAGLRLGAGSHEAKALRGATLSPLLHIAVPGPNAAGMVLSAGPWQRAPSWWRQKIRQLPGAFDLHEWKPWINDLSSD